MRGFDARIQRGIDLTYNLRFEEAERHFQTIVAAEPDNPLGYFFRAMVSWWRILLDLADKTYDAEFHARLQQCIEVCDRRLAKDPMDFDAILFKGGAIGFRGRLYGDREQYVRAARDGLRCLPLLKKSRQLEPTNKDILFGQGLYHYFAEVMPQRHRNTPSDYGLFARRRPLAGPPAAQRSRQRGSLRQHRGGLFPRSDLPDF